MSDTPSKASGPARYANGRFGPGNAGRRAGSRNRLTHQAILSILEDFETHKKELFTAIRFENSPGYFNTLTRFLPRIMDDDGRDFADYSDAEAAGVIRLVRQALAVSPDPRNALAELDAILAKDPAACVAKAG